MHRIFLVEDDPMLRQGLRELLLREGYEVVAVGSRGEAAQRWEDLLASQLIVLDVMLPDGDGIQMCRAWRQRGLTIPILFLTALDEEASVVQGLDAGGDDYVTKPFRMQELLGRVRALLRRHPHHQLMDGGLIIDLNALTATLDGEALPLTQTEFRLAAALLRAKGRVLTRGQLLQSIWDAEGQFVDENTLSVHISRLRDKLGRRYIRTVRGVGYTWP